MKKSNHDFPEHLVPIIKKDFQRIYNTLVIFWGAVEFQDFMQPLLLMTSDRTDREGFTVDVMRELIAISLAHEQLFPQFVPNDIWGIV